MKHIHKLKPLNEWWVGLVYIGNGVIALISAILGLIELYLLFLGCVLVCVALINVIISIRMGNHAQLAGALHYFIIALACFSVSGGNQRKAGIFIGFFFFTLFWNVSLLVTKKTKWRKREVLELAAFPVEEIGSGFTARPKPTGVAEYNRDDILELANFLSKNLIAIPYIEKDKAVMVITRRHLNHLLNFKNDYFDETYVSFDYQGNVTVNITKEDYSQYRDALSFDKLCESLGNLFKEFLELNKKDESEKIIDRMNALKLSPFEGIMLF